MRNTKYEEERLYWWSRFNRTYTNIRHKVGDIDCDDCMGQPYVHEDCGGIVHTNRLYDIDDGDAYSWFMCDKCGWEDET